MSATGMGLALNWRALRSCSSVDSIMRWRVSSKTSCLATDWSSNGWGVVRLRGFSGVGSGEGPSAWLGIGRALKLEKTSLPLASSSLAFSSLGA